MSKTIATENAPAAIGPYVQGVDLGNMIITSGSDPRVKSEKRVKVPGQTSLHRHVSRWIT